MSALITFSVTASESWILSSPQVVSVQSSCSHLSVFILCRPLFSHNDCTVSPQSCLTSAWPEQKRSGGPRQHLPQSLKLKVDNKYKVCPSHFLFYFILVIYSLSSRCWFFRQGVEPGADQAGHIKNFPPTVYLPEGQPSLTTLWRLMKTFSLLPTKCVAFHKADNSKRQRKQTLNIGVKSGT